MTSATRAKSGTFPVAAPHASACFIFNVMWNVLFTSGQTGNSGPVDMMTLSYPPCQLAPTRAQLRQITGQTGEGVLGRESGLGPELKNNDLNPLSG